jgi:hypothetical protein
MRVSVTNPHISAWRVQARRQAQLEGPLRRMGGLVVLVTIGAAAPVVTPVFFGFLGRPEALAAGVAGIGLRLGLVLCGAMALATYSALVRSPERAILDPHPVEPAALLRYLLLRTAVERFGWVLGAAVFLLPLLIAGEFLGWCLATAVAAGGWAVGLLSGFSVHLAAIWVAESPSLAWVLELIRGQNPRLQAALIYAPGAALGLGGVTVWAASLGAAGVLAGRPDLGFLLLVPLGVGAIAWSFAGGLGRAWYHRATTLLGEIDAAYQGQEDPEEAKTVYLEWAIRGLPPALRLRALRELRAGWRAHRSWLTGAWGLGAVAAVSAWSTSDVAGARAAAVASAGMVVVAAVSFRLQSESPEWLDAWLGLSARQVRSARGLAVLGWLQGLVVLPVLALAIRQGWAASLRLAIVLELTGLALAIVASGTSGWRRWGWAAYLPLAIVIWATSAAGSLS